MRSLNTILSFAAGSMVGVAIGVLTAPRSGKKTRKLINNEVKMKKKEMQELAENRIQEAKDILNTTVEKQAKNGKKAIDRVKEVVTVS